MHDPQMPEGRPDADVVDLDEWLDTQSDGLVDYESEPRNPEDGDKANWLLRKVARLERQQKTDVDLAAREIERIRLWLESRTQIRDHKLAWLRQSLEGFMRVAELRDNTKTINLPNGCLRLRKPTPRVVVHDEKAFIAWATKNLPDGVRVKIEVAKAEIKKATQVVKWEPDPVNVAVEHSELAVGGEYVPGVEMEQAAQSTFSWEVS